MADDARLRQLLDREEIMGRLIAMSRGSDRNDRDLFLSAAHADAVCAVGPFVGSPAELYDWSAGLGATNSGTSHHLSNLSCEIDGDTAHTEAYYLFVARNLDGTNLLAGGRYVDRFERRDGAWRIALRNNFIEWSSVVPAVTGPLGEVPDLLANGAPARGRGDVSYLRPLVNHRAPNVPGRS